MTQQHVTPAALDLGTKGCGKCVRCYCQMMEIRDDMKKRRKTKEDIQAALKARFKTVTLTHL